MQPSDSGHTGQRVGLADGGRHDTADAGALAVPAQLAGPGLITGLSTGSHYLMTLGAQDLIDVVAGLVASSAPFPDSWSDARRRSVAALVSELGAVPLGLGLTAYLDRGGCLHPGAWRGAAGGVAVWGPPHCAAACSSARRPARGPSTGRWAPAGGSPPCPSRSRSACSPQPSSSAPGRAVPEPTTAGLGRARATRRRRADGPRAGSRGSGARRALGRGMGRAMDRRAGASARARPDPRAPVWSGG